MPYELGLIIVILAFVILFLKTIGMHFARIEDEIRKDIFKEFWDEYRKEE